MAQLPFIALPRWELWVGSPMEDSPHGFDFERERHGLSKTGMCPLAAKSPKVDNLEEIYRLRISTERYLQTSS